MPRLWYDYDEVTEFHPIVEEVLNNALENCGYSEIAEVLHHPTIPNSNIIPDFAIRLRDSNRYIFVMEVKKTNRDCYSQRFQNQTRSYVTDLAPYWEPHYHKYFCLTNVETLSLFAEREGAISSCILRNYPTQYTPINANNHDATVTIHDFQQGLENILREIFNRNTPEWSNNWEQIINSFYQNYESIKNILIHDESISKDVTLFELFRLIAFSFLKTYYNQRNETSKIPYFRGLPTERDNTESHIRKLQNSYNRILELDFRQIFSNYPNPNTRIFPENLSDNIVPYFKDIIQNLNNYCNSAVADNSSPDYIFNLLTSKIYDKTTMHNKGQIMSDSELSILLSTLLIDSSDCTILDPCCGDGSLLDASYDSIKLLSLNENAHKTHNEILSQVNGIEIDPFLSQLATFRLLAKNLSSINTLTEANILIGDTFLTEIENQIDRIIINPPFLRNESQSITSLDKDRMIQAIEDADLECFVTNARQPNLYFYFINYVWKYLNNTGKAGFIIMAKFLNSLDGRFVKEFMLDKVDAIILYPNNYFQDFKVTTVIAVLSKQPQENIKFLRILNEDLLINPLEVKNILTQNITTVSGDYTLKICDRNILPSSNWRLPFIDPNDKFQTLNNLDIFENLNTFFNIGRGNAETKGGSKIIFPNFNSEPYSAIQDDYIGFGIKNNRKKRNLILTVEDLEIEQAIHFPCQYDANTTNGLNDNYNHDVGLNTLFNNNNHQNPNKWEEIVNSSFNNKINFDILIPRADRQKHICYYNSFNTGIVLSTNFLYLNGVRNINQEIDTTLQIKFITAFLVSSFGQIQFEINSNNQEGLRKMEQFHLHEFKIVNPNILSIEEIETVVTQFEQLNTLNQLFTGEEGIMTPRRNLDISIGNIIFNRNGLNFNNAEELVNHYELFLVDLIEDRKI